MRTTSVPASCQITERIAHGERGPTSALLGPLLGLSAQLWERHFHQHTRDSEQPVGGPGLEEREGGGACRPSRPLQSRAVVVGRVAIMWFWRWAVRWSEVGLGLGVWKENFGVIVTFRKHGALLSCTGPRAGHLEFGRSC